MDILERYVAIDNKCAWPNLTLMPDGSLLAAIFGEPCHLLWEGAAECWRSQDGGRTWLFASVPVPNQPLTNRGNLAAGLTHSGAYVLLCGGWSNVCPKGERSSLPVAPGVRSIMPPIVARSEDGGSSWSHESLELDPETSNLFVYGDILCLPGNRLAAACYVQGENDCTAWIYFSDDDGRTWEDARVIGYGRYNETALLSLGEDRLIAASRAEFTAETEIFASDDGGQSWTCRDAVTPARHMPAHLTQLQDTSILLTYGVRLRGMLGVYACISRDGGQTWDAPRVLFNTSAHQSDTSSTGTDGGYPSSVQLADGNILTAYYCQRISMHQRYHMGVVIWRE